MTSEKRILMLFDNMNRDYVSRLQAGATRQAKAAGVSVEAENIHGTSTTVANLLERPGIAGVILTAPLCDDRHVILQLEKKGLPFARIASMLDPGRGITVSMDEYEAAREITGLLLDAGHRRIGIIRGPRSHLASMRRYNGFTAAMGTKGGRADPALVVEGDFTAQSGKQLAPKLLAGRPTAIFSSNDGMAAGFIEAARAAGYAMPGQISIVGFDDDPMAKTLSPPLTTVRQPLEEMGATACKLLADHLGGTGKAVAHADVPYTIVQRSSIAAPAGEAANAA